MSAAAGRTAAAASTATHPTAHATASAAPAAAPAAEAAAHAAAMVSTAPAGPLSRFLGTFDLRRLESEPDHAAGARADRMLARVVALQRNLELESQCACRLTPGGLNRSCGIELDPAPIILSRPDDLDANQ